MVARGCGLPGSSVSHGQGYPERAGTFTLKDTPSQHHAPYKLTEKV